MIVSAIVTIVFRQLRQPVVLGYILAGVIIGPHTPPFPLIADEDTIRTLSELGIVFLMFSLGLEFSFGKLRQVGATALLAASLEIIVLVGLGYGLGRWFGWSVMDSVFLGAILSISSTTIIIKTLEELKKTRERFAQLIFGILIIEDILGIAMIALLSGFATTGSLTPREVGATVLQLGSFLGILLVVGLIFVPRLLNYVARFKSNEMLLITVLGLCFGVSLLAVKMNYSVALGAFLIGAIVAESRQIGKIESLMHPVRDLFSAVFFVSIGLLIDPALLVKHWGAVLAITAAVVIGKVGACAFGTFLAGHDTKSSLRVGMGLAQIGEFSFIIASLGLSLKVTSDFLYPIAVAVSALTTLLTPYLIRSSDWFVARFERSAPAPLHRLLGSYTHWAVSLSRGPKAPAGLFLRKWAWQIGLNLLLVSAIFLSAAFLSGKFLPPLTAMTGSDNLAKGVLWLGAAVVSLPLFIATWRKLQAAGCLIAEVTISEATEGRNALPLRAMVENLVLFAGSLATMFAVGLLSSAILPSRNLLIALALLLVVAVILLRRPFIRLYASAQYALQETFATPPAEPVIPESLSPVLAGAELNHIKLGAASRALGQSIAQLRLRSSTGASIVGIERAGEKLINPGPDEELQIDDDIVLLGSPAQLESARAYLDGKQ